MHPLNALILLRHGVVEETPMDVAGITVGSINRSFPLDLGLLGRCLRAGFLVIIVVAVIGSLLCRLATQLVK